MAWAAQRRVIAAAGLYALEHHVERLADDHERARRLARGLAELPGVAVDADRVETNIVIFDVGGTGLDTAEFSRRLKQQGVLINGIDARQMRLLTHHDVDRAACERALKAIAETARAGRAVLQEPAWHEPGRRGQRGDPPARRGRARCARTRASPCWGARWGW